ncbi:MAG: DUF2064 domain-containing protein [Methanobacteriota archaeon]|nr:MAG: DUF2064 domain-containing protein [Euryarchaeota archaeon]
MKGRDGLLVFAKAPVKGLVKTRLKAGTPLCDREVLRLYESFLADVLAAAERTEADQIYLSYHPAGSGNVMEGFVGERGPAGVRLFPQEGRDFDERFTKAVESVLRECQSVIVIGSDLPHIQPRTINRGFGFLRREGGMVLGPSGEGGVYLVGVTRPLDFTGVFTAGVEMDNLTGLARKRGLRLLLLEELTDIDVAGDLATFICAIQAMEYAAECGDYQLPRNTIQTVREMGLEVRAQRGGERNRRIVKR